MRLQSRGVGSASWRPTPPTHSATDNHTQTNTKYQSNKAKNKNKKKTQKISKKKESEARAHFIRIRVSSACATPRTQRCKRTCRRPCAGRSPPYWRLLFTQHLFRLKHFLSVKKKPRGRWGNGKKARNPHTFPYREHPNTTPHLSHKELNANIKGKLSNSNLQRPYPPPHSA